MGIRACKNVQDLEELAAQAGMRAKIISDGRYQIRSSDGQTIKTFSNLEDAGAYVNGLVKSVDNDLDGSSNIPHRGQAASSHPNRPQSQINSKTRKVISELQAGFAAGITPIKNFFQSVENLGGPALFEKVYQTTQNAKLLVNRVLTRDKIEGLAGRTYMKALHELDRRLADLPLDQRNLSTLYAEAFTKEEIARAGVFSAKGISQDAQTLGRGFEQLGIAEDVPILLRKSAIAEDFMENQSDLLKKFIPTMRNDIAAGRLPQELSATLDNLVAIAGEEKTLIEVLQSMGLTQNEYNGILLLKRELDKGTDIIGAYRYAIAPAAKPGFKNGKAQFASERGMSSEAVAIAEERRSLLKAAFKREADLDSEMLIGAQYPVFRQFADAGLFPSMRTMKGKSGMMRKYSKVLDSMEEGSQIFSRRVLSGHLNPYELHPSITAGAHVRNVVMRKHFDKTLSEAAKFANESLPDIPDNTRLRKMTLGYLNEIEGIPDESFESLTNYFREVRKMMGMSTDDKLGERVVQVLTRTTSQATIPFRVGLIARNMTQSPFFVIPVMGPKAWLHGVKASVGMVDGGKFSFSAMRESIEEAIQAGAIDPNVIPLHASDEMFGIGSSAVGGNLSPMLAKAKFKADELFDMGFSIYRTPDDWGRVVAFKAGKYRVNQHIGKFMEGRIDLDEFVRRSKAGTFNEATERQFRAIVQNEAPGWQQAAADFIGKEMADKAHLLYGNANHPSGWGGVKGRLFGQFGTFPTQYLNFVSEGLTRGSLQDRAEFAAMHSAMNMGVIVAGSEAFGLNLTSWATMGSLNYTGGPYMEGAVSLFQAFGGSEAEQRIARRNLMMMLPTLSSPESVLIPGSYFIGDAIDAAQSKSFGEFFGEAAGFRFLENGEQPAISRGFENLMDQF